MLNGKIFEIRLYNRALSEDEVAASFSGQPVVSEADVLAELSQAERDRVVELRKLISEREQDVKQFDAALGPHDPLARVAHAIFNLKEFIYIR